MGKATPNDVHVDAALTDISTAYEVDANNYVAGQVFPAVPVNHQTDKYHRFDKNDWFRDDAVRKRAPEAESAGTSFGVSQDSYSCDVWASHIDISDQIRANADPAVPLEDAAARNLMQRFLIRKERQFSADYFVIGKWGTDLTPTTLWDVPGTSDPEDDVDVGKKTILQNTGMEVNTMVVSFEVHQALKKHPLILERYKYTSSASVTSAVLANFFEVDRYLVAKGTFASNEESGTEAYAFALGKHCLLLHVAPSPGIMVPTAGLNFAWAGLTGINDLGAVVRNIDMRAAGKQIDRIELECAFDMKIVGSDLGYLIDDAVS